MQKKINKLLNNKFNELCSDFTERGFDNNELIQFVLTNLKEYKFIGTDGASSRYTITKLIFFDNTSIEIKNIYLEQVGVSRVFSILDNEYKYVLRNK